MSLVISEHWHYLLDRFCSESASLSFRCCATVSGPDMAATCQVFFCMECYWWHFGWLKLPGWWAHRNRLPVKGLFTRTSTVSDCMVNLTKCSLPLCVTVKSSCAFVPSDELVNLSRCYSSLSVKVSVRCTRVVLDDPVNLVKRCSVKVMALCTCVAWEVRVNLTVLHHISLSLELLLSCSLAIPDDLVNLTKCY